MAELDRSKIDALVAGATNAPESAVGEPIHLPGLGLDCHLRPLTRREEIAAASHARPEAFDPDDEDAMAMVEAEAIVGALRYALVDAKGDHLLTSFKQSAAFLEALDDEDFATLGAALNDVRSPVVRDVEEGKGSSPKSRRSSASTTSRTSRAGASRASSATSRARS